MCVETCATHPAEQRGPPPAKRPRTHDLMPAHDRWEEESHGLPQLALLAPATPDCESQHSRQWLAQALPLNGHRLVFTPPTPLATEPHPVEDAHDAASLAALLGGPSFGPYGHMAPVTPDMPMLHADGAADAYLLFYRRRGA